MENKDIKLFALDLDGTCLDVDHLLNEYTYDVIQQLNKKYIVVPSSGRSFDGMSHFFKGIDIPYYITANGAIFYDGKTGKPLFSYKMDYQLVAYIIHQIKDNDCIIYVQRDAPHQHDFCCANKEIYNKHFKQRIKQDYDNICHDLSPILMQDKLYIYKFGIWFTNIEQLEIVQKQLIQQYGNVINVFRADYDELEISSVYASKGSSLHRLCDYLHLINKQVCAIGDSGNDISMLDYAGLSVAMGNAMDDVKLHAELVIDKNYNDGLAHFLEDNFLSKEY